MAEFPSELNFARPVCSDPQIASQREWLVTNGIGGFACGTISGELTRRYHGLLVAALNPPLGRTLLVTKFNETAIHAGERYSLSTDRVQGSIRDVTGCSHIERFYLDGSIPVWHFILGEALLEKSVWMEQGANTTYIQYTLLRGAAQTRLEIQLLVNFRDYHAVTTSEIGIETALLPNGVQIEAGNEHTRFYVLCKGGEFLPRTRWMEGYSLSVEQYRGFEGLENHLHCADFMAALHLGERLTLVACLDPAADLDGSAAVVRRKSHEAGLLQALAPVEAGDRAIMERLALAADQFIVERAINGLPAGHSVIAGYPWFGDWGRDTMISLPGLTLATGRPEIARSLLLTFAEFIDQGMLPNRFPDEGQEPEYNTVDATLWYFEALRAYIEHVALGGDEDAGTTLLEQVYPRLQQIIDWHQRGTRYQIHIDHSDGLVYAGEPGVQLTWMDAKVGDWVVTPRIGKPVEINALWYNALRCMEDFSSRLGEATEPYVDLARRCESGFERFWNSRRGYCFDVIDSPDGDDASLRPNQLLAAALPYPLLTGRRARRVVDACARSLYTSNGLRSLAPFEKGYQGRYGGDLRTRDAAYHQGTVWSWLVGPFVRAHLNAYGDRRKARSYLLPLVEQLADHGVGSISEIFDGDPPFTPRGCFAQAWSVAELLSAWLDTRE